MRNTSMQVHGNQFTASVGVQIRLYRFREIATPRYVCISFSSRVPCSRYDVQLILFLYLRRRRRRR